MPTAPDTSRPHVHTWSRQDKAVYCLDCSLHFTERIAELEQQVATLTRWRATLRGASVIDAMPLP